MKKLTLNELTEILKKDDTKTGVIVIKNGPYFLKEFPLEARSYRVIGGKHFKDGMIGDSIFAESLDGSDPDVRLDWYLKADKPEDRWQIEYCYILEK